MIKAVAIIFFRIFEGSDYLKSYEIIIRANEMQPDGLK